MADTRNCEQCGAVFAPRREHGRFRSARCRVAWNREKTTDPLAEVNALQWSITAMRDTTERLPRVRAWDRRRAVTVIGEAGWWVTIGDGTPGRYHPATYDRVLAGQPPAARGLLGGTPARPRVGPDRIGPG